MIHNAPTHPMIVNETGMAVLKPETKRAVQYLVSEDVGEFAQL